jgi:hypothetical protein
LHFSTILLRDIKFMRMRWKGNVLRMGEIRNSYEVSVGKPQGERPSVRHGRTWEDNIKTDLKKDTAYECNMA